MKKVLVILLSLFVGFSSLLQLSAYVHDNYDYGNFPYIALVPPPPEALAADYGTPLVTIDIGLFAYYQESSWDLNDIIPAFHNYTQYSNYVDGYVRVWIDVTGTNFVGSMSHNPSVNNKYAWIDVSVRVRSDGWILAWIEDTQNKAFICHWGHTTRNSMTNALPNDYETCLSRAIHRVYHNAGVSWVGYDQIFYYDYEFPDATRLSVFGLLNRDGAGASPSDEHFYFVIPSGVTIEAGYVCGSGYSDTTDYIRLDGVEKIGGTTGFGWYAVDVTGDLSVDTKHDVRVYHDAGSSSGIACSFLLWTS